MPTPPSASQVVKTVAELQKALANPAVKTITLDASIGSVGDVFKASHLVNINLNNRTLTGDLKIQTAQTGTIELSAGTSGKIVGNLVVNAQNATVNNSIPVEGGNIIITDVALGTWNENAHGNKIVVEDKTGIVLNIAPGKKVGSLILNQSAIVTVGEGAGVINPIVVNASSTIVSKESVSAIIKEEVEVTLKAEKDDVEGIVLKGNNSEGSVDLIAAVVAIQAAQDAIDAIEEKEIYSADYKTAVTNAENKVKSAKDLGVSDEQIGVEKVAKLDAANTLISSLNNIKNKFTAIAKDNGAIANNLIDAVKNAPIDKIKKLENKLGEVVDDAIPAGWISYISQYKNGDIVDFFKTGPARSKETVERAMGNGIPDNNIKIIILEAYDALMETL